MQVRNDRLGPGSVVLVKIAKCHIYVFEASNSLVDTYIVNARDSKAEVVEDYMDKLRLVDEAELDVSNITPDR